MKGYEKLDELSFAELYVEISDDSFPHLRKVLYDANEWLRKRGKELLTFMLLLLTNKLTPPRLRV